MQPPCGCWIWRAAPAAMLRSCTPGFSKRSDWTFSWPLLAAARRLIQPKIMKADSRRHALLPCSREFRAGFFAFHQLRYFPSAAEDARVLRRSFTASLNPAGFSSRFSQRPARCAARSYRRRKVNLGQIRVIILRWVDEAEKSRQKKMIKLCVQIRNASISNPYIYMPKRLADMFRSSGLESSGEYGNYQGRRPSANLRRA